MVTWGNNQFYINGEPLEIHAGSIHYFRSLPERWYELLLKLKQCGLNTVETYCAWNLHEEYEGEFNFSGALDVVRFIEIAEELGLYVIVRPGPYICAEWEFGALPAWLLKDESMRFRTNEGPYLEYVRRYFDKLMPLLVPHMETRGGNIILFAAENEYGSFGNSTPYMNACADLIRSYGVDVPIFTSDGHTRVFIDGGHADDCLVALDYGYDNGALLPVHTAALEAVQPDAPFLHIEHWIGMFAHWDEPYQGYRTDYTASEVRKHLERGASFNLYMFHGGTNFGFTNGANDGGAGYQPDVTSYDYDAPLTEWGEITPKYLAIQQAMSEHLGVELPKPDPVPLQVIGDVALTEAAPLFANLDVLGERHTSAVLHGMEYYGQNYGYILYRTQLTTKEPLDKLVFSGLADRVHAYHNGVYLGTVYRNDAEQFLDVRGRLQGGGTLELLVENMGRINFGPWMDRGDRKGILNHVYTVSTDGPRQLLNNWEVYTLPMKSLDGLTYGGDIEAERPVFYKGTFKTDSRADCFVHLDNFEKGFVVVNGFNLGRYWSVGPQLSLYLPGLLLKDENEIVVYSDKPVESPVISILDTHILDATRTDEGPVTIV